MSTCPEREILSVYLDGELPEKFTAQLETHLADCPDCARQLERITMTHQAFKADADAITFTADQLDDSFARLKAKQSYRRVALEPDFARPAPRLAWGALAAAALFALVLPLQLRQSPRGNATTSTAAAGVAASVPPASPATLLERGVSSNDHAALAAFASYGGGQTYGGTSRGLTYTASSEQQGISVNFNGQATATIDIFRPDFPQSGIRININLETVPGISGTDRAASLRFSNGSAIKDSQYWQGPVYPISFSVSE